MRLSIIEIPPPPPRDKVKQIFCTEFHNLILDYEPTVLWYTCLEHWLRFVRECSHYANKICSNLYLLSHAILIWMPGRQKMVGVLPVKHAPEGWGVINNNYCNNVKSNPHLIPGWGGGGGVKISIDKCITTFKTWTC